MDPFSLATGIITLIGASSAAVRTFKRISDLRRAPDLLQSIDHELSDLHLAALSINDYMEIAQVNGTTDFRANDTRLRQSCAQVLDQTKEKVLELQTLIHRRILRPGRAGKLKISRFHFLQEEDRLIRLQKDLRNARLRMLSLFSYFGLREASKIEILLKDLHYNGVQIKKDVLQALSVLDGGQARLENKLERALNTQFSSQTTLPAARPESLVNPLYEKIHVSVARTNDSVSQRTCHCRRRGWSKTVHTYIGCLFFGYIAPLGDRRQKKQCCCEWEREAVFVYYFPSWFIRRALLLRAGYSGFANPSFSLSIVQYLPPDHNIWTMIYMGDVKGIQKLFSTGQVSIRAESPNGTGLFLHSILCGNLETVDFFFSMRADVYAKTHSPSLAYQMAWDRILTNTRTPDWCSRVKSRLSRLPISHFDELYNFSPLHKAVLGLEGQQLDDAFSAVGGHIDIADQNGRTPLSWAVQCGNSCAVQELLNRGANCNKPDNNGIPPLLFASHSSNDCIKLLIKAGANLQARKSLTDSGVLFVVLESCLRSGHHPLKIVETLVDAGCDVNDTNGYGTFVLGTAILWKSTKIANYLITHGADITQVDPCFGHSPLCAAVWSNCHSILELLLSKRLDHTGQLKTHGTLMHLTAENADLKTLRLLERASLELRDVNVKHKEGLTPFQVASKREDVDAGWRKAFADFLSSVDKDRPQRRSIESRGCLSTATIAIELAGRSDDGSLSDEFEDAVESQEAQGWGSD